MRVRQLVIPLSLIFIAVLLMFAVNGSKLINQTPVGTPQVYTTFISDNSTATPDYDHRSSSWSQIRKCSTSLSPINGILVFRLWTPEADKELFRADGSGKHVCQLTDNSVTDEQPTLSPDGTKVAFVSLDSDYKLGIFTMNSDGTGRTQVTGGGSAYSFPDWSPDGKRLIFQATINELFDLYTIYADGTDLRNLTNNVSLDTTPAWSPDGLRIAFASDRTFDPRGFVKQRDSFEIYVMNADGSNVRRLTSNDRMDISPAWSLDGQQIAFESEGQVKVIDINGDNLRPITNTVSIYQHTGSPVWMPDGQHITFIAYGSIYTIDLDGSNPQLLAQGMPFTYLDAWWPS